MYSLSRNLLSSRYSVTIKRRVANKFPPLLHTARRYRRNFRRKRSPSRTLGRAIAHRRKTIQLSPTNFPRTTFDMALCSVIVLRCTVSGIPVGSYEIKTTILRPLFRVLSLVPYFSPRPFVSFSLIYSVSLQPPATGRLLCFTTH